MADALHTMSLATLKGSFTLNLPGTMCPGTFKPSGGIGKFQSENNNPSSQIIDKTGTTRLGDIPDVGTAHPDVPREAIHPYLVGKA